MKSSYIPVLTAMALIVGSAQAQPPVQTKNGLSLYFWIYPTATPGVTLPGQLPDGEGTPGVAVAVQSSDTTVTAFVVTLNYVATDGSSQTTVHKFTAAATGFTTEMFPVGVIQKVAKLSVIPVVQAQEVVFDQSAGAGGSTRDDRSRRSGSQ